MPGFQHKIGSHLHPLNEVVDCNQNVLVSVRGLGAILPITSMPHMEKGHGEVILYRSLGGT